jgi:peroxiredoxin
MSSAKRLLWTMSLIIFAAFSAWITYRAKALEQEAARDGYQSPLLKKPAPDFSLQTLDGRPVTVSEFKGKRLVIVSFWASWCGPCRMEMPVLRGFYEKNQGKAFEVLAISIDQDPRAAEKFAKEKKLPFPVLLDEGQKVAETYQVKGIPSLFIIDKDGTIDYFQEGFNPGMEYFLDAKLKEVATEK